MLKTLKVDMTLIQKYRHLIAFLLRFLLEGGTNQSDF